VKSVQVRRVLFKQPATGSLGRIQPACLVMLDHGLDRQWHLAASGELR
jgi:hypothetical protein